MVYNKHMKTEEMMNEIIKRAGASRSEIGRRLGVSPQSVSQSIAAGDRIGLNKAINYINAAGHSLYVVPNSLHIELISDDVIKLESDTDEQAI